MSRKNRRITTALSCLIILGLLAYAGYIYKLSGDVLYFFKTRTVWQAEKKRTCNAARKNYIYADLRPETLARGGDRQPLEISCKDPLKLPLTEHYALNHRQMKVHYVRYISPKVSEQAPILLFVPGISANYLAGARYYGLAERLGAELVIMEPTNHGWSDDDGSGAAFGCREKHDVVAVVKDLLTHNQRKMYVFTTSMGGMTFTNALPELRTFAPQIFGVTLENPPSSLRDVMVDQAHKRDLPEFMVNQVHGLAQWRAGLEFGPCATVNQVKHVFTPTQITGTPQDHLVPLPMVKKVFEALPTLSAMPGKASSSWHEFRVYPHGGHSIIWNGQPEVFEKDLQAFWQKSMAWHQAKYPDSYQGDSYQGSTLPSQ